MTSATTRVTGRLEVDIDRTAIELKRPPTETVAAELAGHREKATVTPGGDRQVVSGEVDTEEIRR